MITQELPVAIKKTPDRERLFTDLYEKTFPTVARFVSNRRGSLQEAKDIFQDALVIFYEKMVQGKLEVTLTDERYLLGISKHLWIRKFKQDSKHVLLDEHESAIKIPGDYFEEVHYNDHLITAFLKSAGKKCMELLTAFYYHNYSMKEIIRAFRYGSERSATVQKFKCLEKVRDRVKEKSMDYESFTE